jgi:galactokinase
MSASLHEAALQQFCQRFGGTPRLFRAPGRINIIGEHLDYNGGWVMPAALDRYTVVAAGNRSDRSVTAHFTHQNLDCEFTLDSLRETQASGPAAYLRAVALALTDLGLDLAGCDLLVSGDLPLGSGLSSSASLEVSLALALLDASGEQLSPLELARLCQRAEAEYVGVQCGIMDQLAITTCEGRNASLINCATLAVNPVPLPRRAKFVLVHSGRQRQLVNGHFNQLRARCNEAVELLGAHGVPLRNLAELEAGQLEAHRNLLGDETYRVCRHVVTEQQRVGEARDALQQDDATRLGTLMTESHASLRDDYRVSCSELDQLVECLLKQPGTLGARLMGAGFGGCVLALVENDEVKRVLADVLVQRSGDSGHAPWSHVVGQAEHAGLLPLVEPLAASG